MYFIALFLYGPWTPAIDIKHGCIYVCVQQYDTNTHTLINARKRPQIYMCTYKPTNTPVTLSRFMPIIPYVFVCGGCCCYCCCITHQMLFNRPRRRPIWMNHVIRNRLGVPVCVRLKITTKNYKQTPNGMRIIRLR